MPTYLTAAARLLQSVTSVTSDVSTLTTAVNTATTTADDAAADAATALSTANTAQTTAEAAQTTADGLAADVATAQSDAADAATDAATALTTAQSAEAAAVNRPKVGVVTGLFNITTDNLITKTAAGASAGKIMLLTANDDVSTLAIDYDSSTLAAAAVGISYRFINTSAYSMDIIMDDVAAVDPREDVVVTMAPGDSVTIFLAGTDRTEGTPTQPNIQWLVATGV
jgi:hypothetical protein